MSGIKENKIIEGIKRLNKSFGIQDGAPIIEAIINKVDGMLCEAEVDGVAIPDVQLMTLQSGANKSIVVVPKVGSNVLLATIDSEQRYVVISVEEAEELRVKVGSKTLDVLDDNILLNGGDFGGLVKIKELEDNLESLKKYVETMKTAIAQGITAVGVSTAANGATGAASFNAAMASQVIVLKDMENKNVKHG